MTTPISTPPTSAVHDEHRLDVIKEASTMALYVAICLLAALIAASHNHVEDNSNAVTLIWGTALGLALAHWFAFRVSSRLVARGSICRADTVLALAQIGGATAVAVVATVPAVALGGSTGPRLHDGCSPA